MNNILGSSADTNPSTPLPFDSCCEKENQHCREQQQQLEQPLTEVMSSYEQSPDALKECFSMISIDLEDEDSTALCDLDRQDGDSAGKKPQHDYQHLVKQIEALQMRLKRSEEEKELLRKERAAKTREIANLRKCLKTNQVVRCLEKKVGHMEVEKDYFVREIRVLEDKVDELQKINEAKSCQLDVFDKLFRAMGANDIGTANSQMISNNDEKNKTDLQQVPTSIECHPHQTKNDDIITDDITFEKSFEGRKPRFPSGTEDSSTVSTHSNSSNGSAGSCNFSYVDEQIHGEDARRWFDI